MDKRKVSLTKASFLKILQSDFVNKLPIPPAFINNFEGEIPPWFIIEIAGTRKCWRVDTEHDENGTVYLGYGFDCFVKEHSLETGNFLLFKHENPSILEVEIYEKDGSKRTEEMTSMSEHEVGAASESPTEIPLIHHEETASLCPTSNTLTSVQYGAIRKQCGVIGNGIGMQKFSASAMEHEFEVGAASKSPTEMPLIHHEGNASPCPTSDTLTHQYRAIKKQRGVIGNGNGKKKLFASATEHGVCFSLTWRLAHHYLYYMTIPREMLYGKNISDKERITVQDGEGNSWQVELRRRADGRVDLARGWKDFVDYNGLTNGDMLTFKFVSDDVIQVLVQRVSQANDLSRREQEGINQPSEHNNLTCEDRELADVCTPTDKAPLTMRKFGRFSSELNSFTCTWTDKARNSRLHIPKAIANKQKLENNDIVILCDPKGKQWLTEVKTRQDDGRVSLGRGWSDFTKAYGFGVGDTLGFEFVTDRMIKVDVVKACELYHPISGAITKQEVHNLH